MGVQKTDLYPPPSVASGGRIRYAPTTGYVRPFKKLSRFRPLRGRGVGRIQYASTTGYVQSFKIPMLFPNRVRVVLSKNCLVFVLFGAACGAYSIRPYDWVHAILRNTDAIPQPGMCGPSKNCPVFVPFGAAGWDVFNTPLQLGTCNPSKYRCYSLTGYVLSFRKTVLFSSSSGPPVGRIQYAPTTGYMQSFEIPMLFPNRVCAALQKTVPFSPPSRPLVGRIRYASTTGYVRSYEIPI